MKKIIYISITALTFLSASCKKDYNAGGTNTQAMANEWWVQLDKAGDYYKFSTYNTTANNSNQMILDDNSTFWGNSTDGRVAAKINVNLNALTFSVANSANLNANYPITFSVTDGKILKDAAKAPGSKDVTDSIDFKIEFSDDPGTIYHLSGYARTRFPEDDH